MKNHLLVFGIIFLFLSSIVTPMTTGIDTDTSEVDVELERMFDNLRFMCMGPDGFNSIKYEHYKEQLLKQYSSEVLDDDVIKSDNKESIAPVEQPSTPIVSSGGPMDNPWSIFAHDARHTGLSQYSTADNSGIEKWRFYSAGGSIDETPVIDNDGIIYLCGAYEHLDRYLYAINPDGTEKWKFKTGGLIIWSAPAIAEDGTIYIGSWDSFLYAINSDGTLKWKFFTEGGDISSSAVIGEDGTIYFGDLGDFGQNSKIWAVNPNGTEKWHYTINDYIYSDPAIGDDGTIYIGSNDNYLYAINPDGTLKWRFKTGKEVAGSASIATDGTIYAYGTWDNYLYALHPNNGSVKWKCNIKCNSNPSIGSDGTIYIGGDEKLYAVYPNGTVRWSCFLGNGRWIGGSAPAISADGTIYVGICIGNMEGGEIIAVNHDGIEQWRKRIAKDWVHSSPSIAEDGTVYIGSTYDVSRGYLHAFGPQETNDPPTAPTITGPTEGKVNIEYDFSFKATDPDRNPVSFFIEWGDGETTGWTMDYNTGEKVTYSHTWSEKGNYTIKAKAKDTFGLEGDWATFEIGIIKKDKSTNNVLLWRLVERFPLLQKLLLS